MRGIVLVMEKTTVLVLGTGAALGTLVGADVNKEHPVVAGVTGGLVGAALALPFLGLIALGAAIASSVATGLVDKKSATGRT